MTSILMVMAIVSLVWYALFLFAPSHIDHPVSYTLLVIAEVIGMSQLLGIWITILCTPRHGHDPHILQMKTDLRSGRLATPPVAVFVPVAGESLDIIRPTVTAARDIHLPHRTIILDDGSSDEVQRLAAQLHVDYLRRRDRRGRKAGNINHALAQTDEEFFAVFDSDHVPHPDFLVETLPHLLSSTRLAYVQTPQYHGNRDHFISGGSAQIQDVFYRHIQPGKNAFRAAFCVGTNVLMRRSAVESIGGIYEESNSEDIWTSILLHEKGWESFFLPTVLAVGLAPETPDAFFRQQFRWARGGFEILFQHNPLFRRLSLDQKFQYLLTTTHYLSCICMMIFFILPLLYAYFGIQPLQSPESPTTWLYRFIPYYAMILLATAHLMGQRPLWRSFVVSMTTFPAHCAALLSVLFRINLRWSVTGVIRHQRDYITAVAPHLLLLLLSLGAIPLVFFNERDTLTNTTVIGWLLWNIALLTSICRRAIPGRERGEESARSLAPAYRFSS